MCNTVKNKTVKRMCTNSEKFKELIAFFKKTHEAVKRGALHLRMQKAKLKRFIYNQIAQYKDAFDDWLEAWA